MLRETDMSPIGIIYVPSRMMHMRSKYIKNMVQNIELVVDQYLVHDTKSPIHFHQSMNILYYDFF